MKCRKCKQEFQPIIRNGIAMSVYCITCLIEKGKAKQKKEWQSERKALKEKLKTKSDYQKELQTVFNRYIRQRDKDKPCISCGRPLKEKFDAGHFYSVGSYPNLRYDEDNVHGQCVYCNQHKHGNIAEYTINLPKRIGELRFSELSERRNKPKHFTISDLSEMIKTYKEYTK